MEKIVTGDWEDFGKREIDMATDLLQAMRKQGLPNDFHYSGVKVMLNTHSGYVFLINEDCQVVMLNGDKLESFYTCGNCGNEGFKEEVSGDGKTCIDCGEEII